ncbi:hypothetical protein [Helicobacter himalayensis]|uniref:hypothetical protein n=1 Tax=Helicobacter himalayensis TaxID=1591088 RepID=UPI00083393E6|nr:hypothetical protein [Helicobacter himalayensis]
MKKLHISLLATSLAASAALSAEVTPFGFLGAYYSQGLQSMGAYNSDNKAEQEAYMAAAARLGLDIGLGQNFSFGVGLQGAFPFYQNYYSQNKQQPVGDVHYPQNYDVSDAYLKYDNKATSFVAGRFDVGQFYYGKDRKEYSGMDWLWGNIQGAALNIKGQNIGIWGLWMNSKLGVYGNQNRMAYEMARFGTFSAWKHNHAGEVFMGGVDFDYDVFKFSPYVMFDTDNQHSKASGTKSVLSAGAKVVLDIKGNGVRSITTLRGLWQQYESANQTINPTLLWADEELIFSDIFKIGAGYISTNKYSAQLYGHDNSRFYGYRGGLVGSKYYGTNPLLYGGSNASTWYVFTGLKPDSRLELDLLYSGGDYSEISAVGQLRIFGTNESTNAKIGGGFVSTNDYNREKTNNNKRRNNAIVFLKLSF